MLRKLDLEGLEADQGAGTNAVVAGTHGGEARGVRVAGLEGVDESDARADGGVEQIEKGLLEVDGEVLRLFRGRDVGVVQRVVDGGDGCGVVGEDDEGLENVVELVGGRREGQGCLLRMGGRERSRERERGETMGEQREVLWTESWGRGRHFHEPLVADCFRFVVRCGVDCRETVSSTRLITRSGSRRECTRNDSILRVNVASVCESSLLRPMSVSGKSRQYSPVNTFSQNKK